MISRIIKKLRSRKISYEKWYKRHQVTNETLKKQKSAIKEWKRQPVIGVCIIPKNVSDAEREMTIQSIRNQTYDKWTLCTWNHGKIIESANEIATEWIAFVNEGDCLAPDALYEMLKAAFVKENVELLYSDEDQMTEDRKKHMNPQFKPDFNMDLLRSTNYMGHLLLIKTSLLLNLEATSAYDLVLCCVDRTDKIVHVPKLLYHAGKMQENIDAETDKKAIEAHLQRNLLAAKVENTKIPGCYRVKYEVQDQELISIIIPNKDEHETLKRCIESVLKSTYKRYEIIIVENNSKHSDTFAYYEELTGIAYKVDSAMEGILPNGNRVCVVTWKDIFNYSAINNFGTAYAQGKYLLLLNNDIEIITKDWLEELLGHCQRKDVGIVGCKLLYPDETIQHAGVGIGLGGIANSMFVGMNASENGYCNRAGIQTNYSAVTAACMMIKRSLYEQVGGLTEELAVAYNDIDLCLKAGKLGYRIVYTPYAKAFHYESKSRGKENTPEKQTRLERESRYMLEKWKDIFKNGDPYYNPNLSKQHMDYSLDWS